LFCNDFESLFKLLQKWGRSYFLYAAEYILREEPHVYPKMVKYAELVLFLRFF